MILFQYIRKYYLIFRFKELIRGIVCIIIILYRGNKMATEFLIAGILFTIQIIEILRAKILKQILLRLFCRERETVEMVQYRKEEGCQVVEMECSALAACAKFRKVTWAMLLFSADTLADPHKYQEREWGKTSISIALELALDAVLSVVEE